MVHQITAGTIFHLLLSGLLLPSLFQLSGACPVLYGTVQLIPMKLVNKFQSWRTTLLTKTSWAHLWSPLHKILLCNTPSLTTNQVKTTSLSGILTFHISFQSRIARYIASLKDHFCALTITSLIDAIRPPFLSCSVPPSPWSKSTPCKFVVIWAAFVSSWEVHLQGVQVNLYDVGCGVFKEQLKKVWRVIEVDEAFKFFSKTIFHVKKPNWLFSFEQNVEFSNCYRY